MFSEVACTRSVACWMDRGAAAPRTRTDVKNLARYSVNSQRQKALKIRVVEIKEQKLCTERWLTLSGFRIGVYSNS